MLYMALLAPGCRRFLRRDDSAGEIQQKGDATVAPTIYRPGQTVPVSGIYNVVDVIGVSVGRQITAEEGETFPPTVHPKEYGFVLFRQTVHQR